MSDAPSFMPLIEPDSPAGAGARAMGRRAPLRQKGGYWASDAGGKTKRFGEGRDANSHIFTRPRSGKDMARTEANQFFRTVRDRGAGAGQHHNLLVPPRDRP